MYAASMVDKDKGKEPDAHALSDADIRVFIEAWHSDFGEYLSVEEARERACNLIELLLVLAQKSSKRGGKDS